MGKIIPCEICDKPAEYTIQPEGGSLSYWCSEHFDETVKELER